MRLSLAVLLLLAACFVHAENPTTNHTAKAVKMATPPTIDGVINDDEWKGVPEFEGMVDAMDGQPAPEPALFWLGYDDMMMVHDAILPGMGIPETAGLALYAVVGVALVVWAFRPLRRERLGLTFLTGLALLGGSLVGDEAEDFFEKRIPPLATFLGHAEDVVKFLAYVALCHLCVLLARRVMARTLQAATERAAREAVERAGPRRVAATVLPGRPDDRTTPIPVGAHRARAHAGPS